MNRDYATKLISGSAAEKTLKKLAWNVEDLSQLNADGRQLVMTLWQVHNLAERDEVAYISANAPKMIANMKKQLLVFLQGVYRFRRTPATHIFVLMISPEQRNKKPYALHVQCVPYTNLKHSTCRCLVNSFER